jgi:hypothetical protein
MIKEHPFTCPYCWEPITMLLDLSVREQTYIEDCEVCCRPIRIHYTARGGTLASFQATAVQ